MTTFMNTPNFLKYLMKKQQRRREKRKGKYSSNTNIGFDGAA